jgi:hypothetical protein
MRSKFLAGAAALAITITTVLATAGPASAQRWHHRGFGWGAAGLAAGCRRRRSSGSDLAVLGTGILRRIPRIPGVRLCAGLRL